MAIIQVNCLSQALSRTVTFNVILPIEQQNVSKKKPPKLYKTLYLLHGMFGNHTDWITHTRIELWASHHQIAIVMPSGDNSFYVDLDHTGDLYGAFIGEELVHLTRRMFPLSSKRSDTFIGGLSMGGYGALRNGLKYHQTFSSIVALSSALILEPLVSKPKRRRIANEHLVFGDLKQALNSDKNPKWLIKQLLDEDVKLPRMYIACGLKDPLLDVNRDFVAFLSNHKIKFTYIEDKGQHDWEYWDKHIQKALPWLLSKK